MGKKYKGLRHLFKMAGHGGEEAPDVDVLDGYCFDVRIGRVSFEEDEFGAIGVKAELLGEPPIYQPLLSENPWLFVETPETGTCTPGSRYRITLERIGGE